MATVTPSRLAALQRLRCHVFQTSYNPNGIRTGAKYLRKNLVGPAMINYYPQDFSIHALRKLVPGWDAPLLEEQQRLADVQDRKNRGKGAPKKAKSKAESRRAGKRR
ncbi:mitochondrial ribosomal subunit S27-domain-containing protein [Abortiporus biennis]|nr:mitochondrial ribosomal subunit S27-domain-containing protein [Abortiporus biennis]